MMTTTTTDAELDRRVVDHSWMIWTAGALVAIWVSVLVISILAPDLVSGAQQEHLPLAAFTTWLWGAAATGVVLWTMAKLRPDPDARPIWVGYGIAVGAIWAIAAVAALALPSFETGTDPTKLPLAALLAPVGAFVLTGLAGIVSAVFRRPPTMS
jgi:hypothetical protein